MAVAMKTDIVKLKRGGLVLDLLMFCFVDTAAMFVCEVVLPLAMLLLLFWLLLICYCLSFCCFLFRSCIIFVSSVALARGRSPPTVD